MLHKAWNSKGEMPYCFPRSSIKFQGHTVQNITDFDPNWAFPDYRPVAAFKSLRFALFSNVGLCAACWANFICHHELGPTSVSHPFSSLSSSLGLTGGKYHQKTTIPIFRLILQNVAFPGCFSYNLFYHYLFSLLPSGLFVIAVCGSFSVRELAN